MLAMFAALVHLVFCYRLNMTLRREPAVYLFGGARMGTRGRIRSLLVSRVDLASDPYRKVAGGRFAASVRRSARAR